MYSRNHTLSPLPTVLRQGLKAVATISCVSLVTSFFLLAYLSSRLVVWYFKSNPSKPERIAESTNAAGLPRDVGVQYFGPSQENKRQWRAPNQALVLVLNVLLADVLQASGFFLGVVWLSEDRIADESPTCWAQGWFISMGDLASSTFIATIAVHTYVSLVRGRKVSSKVFYGVITFLWFFVLLMSVIGVFITNNGAKVGGFYVRDVTWCWINSEYEGMRLYLHYLWMLIMIIIGTVSYVLVFIHIYRKDKASGSVEKTVEDGSTASVLTSTNLPPHSPKEGRSEARKRMLFLLYPLIFIVCTAPLALGRILSIGGIKLSSEYLCFAGAMITSNGWLDVLVFSTTRRTILFDASPDEQNLGLDTFSLTQVGQHFGHRVWVTAGGSNPSQYPDRSTSILRKPSTYLRRGIQGSHDRSESQISLNNRDLSGNKGIQMKTVTRVFVEVDSPSNDADNHSQILKSMPSTDNVGERVQQSMDSYR
ncbi:uncharacterized protein CTRU02_208368 [Colletotrichum truncatum]|uniref:Integral membrane protein n=1 Tax=Colletotrichum truncatum TaxID=5467 RepID=A0ACC3YW23_COLTU|nr:uncharacterized protein CTRU02_07446 [Colletotrichum truncatum]KAF6791106.1 integral membrane protein [Colletotrichum truncatum]